MNDKTRVRYEACKRVAQFGVDHAADIPAGSILETKFADIAAKVDEIETLAGHLSEAGGKADQQFQLKAVAREDLNDLLTSVANAARAAEPEHPGTQARFRFNRNLNDADLLAAGNSFHTATAPERATLISYGASATWFADLNDAITAFDTAFSSAAGADAATVAANAEVAEKVAEGMQLKRTIGYIVPTPVRSLPFTRPPTSKQKLPHSHRLHQHRSL
ncbi:MAG TPA: hypothetical protein VGO43_16065 [Pyrinomonadaceae bacterium]|nr:hypothetical protein [Pyrinomonadaceae bacterium]